MSESTEREPLWDRGVRAMASVLAGSPITAEEAYRRMRTAMGYDELQSEVSDLRTALRAAEEPDPGDDDYEIPPMKPKSVRHMVAVDGARYDELLAAESSLTRYKELHEAAKWFHKTGLDWHFGSHEDAYQRLIAAVAALEESPEDRDQ